MGEERNLNLTILLESLFTQLRNKKNVSRPTQTAQSFLGTQCTEWKFLGIFRSLHSAVCTSQKEKVVVTRVEEQHNNSKMFYKRVLFVVAMGLLLVCSSSFLWDDDNNYYYDDDFPITTPPTNNADTDSNAAVGATSIKSNLRRSVSPRQHSVSRDCYAKDIFLQVMKDMHSEYAEKKKAVKGMRRLKSVFKVPQNGFELRLISVPCNAANLYVPHLSDPRPPVNDNAQDPGCEMWSYVDEKNENLIRVPSPHGFLFKKIEVLRLNVTNGVAPYAFIIRFNTIDDLCLQLNRSGNGNCPDNNITQEKDTKIITYICDMTPPTPVTGVSSN